MVDKCGQDNHKVDNQNMYYQLKVNKTIKKKESQFVLAEELEQPLGGNAGGSSRYSSSEEEEELVFGGLEGMGGSLNLPACLEGTLLQIFKFAEATG